MSGGQYQDQEGQSSCKSCAVGQLSIGGSKCCTKNEFKEYYSAQTCCVAGCKQCLEGNHSGSIGGSKCIDNAEFKAYYNAQSCSGIGLT